MRHKHQLRYAQINASVTILFQVGLIFTTYLSCIFPICRLVKLLPLTSTFPILAKLYCCSICDMQSLSSSCCLLFCSKFIVQSLSLFCVCSLNFQTAYKKWCGAENLSSSNSESFVRQTRKESIIHHQMLESPYLPQLRISISFWIKKVGSGKVENQKLYPFQLNQCPCFSSLVSHDITFEFYYPYQLFWGFSVLIFMSNISVVVPMSIRLSLSLALHR